MSEEKIIADTGSTEPVWVCEYCHNYESSIGDAGEVETIAPLCQAVLVPEDGEPCLREMIPGTLVCRETVYERR